MVKKHLLACAAAGLLAVAAPSANALVVVYFASVSPGSNPAATGISYRGNCAMDLVYAAPANGNRWMGTLDVTLTATFNGQATNLPITGVWCELSINTQSWGSVLTAPNGALGATSNAGRLEYQALPTDDVLLCTHATVADVVMPVRCFAPTIT
jgi:hypothetical protein